LSSPWETRGSLDAEVIAALVAGAGEREPASPPAALWRSDREHWLVTDGTGETLEPRPYARVLRVGDVRRNVGLLRLSARRSLEDRSRLDIEIEARNGGDTPDERTVVLSGDSGEIARSTLRLAPGESASIAASTAMSSRLGARLEPNDALEADDSLSLNAGGLEARGTHVDPACPASLVSVLRAHPALMIVGNPADAALAVDCSGTGATSPSALLRFVQGSPPRLLEGPLLWSTSVDSSSRRLGAFAWRTAGRLAPLQRGDSVLLASGTTPLVVRRGERAPPVIETALDTDSLAGDDPAAVPLLVAFLIDEALDASLLDAVAVNARAPDAVLVVPREVSLTEAKPGTATAAADVRRWTRPQLLAALLALLWECVVLLRRLRRELAQAEAWTR
jgi:hypothetical protein